ncbi:MAG: hypothetical protein ACI93R_003410, partial [Flavobacteriales bacterium]
MKKYVYMLLSFILVSTAFSGGVYYGFHT